MWSDRDNSAATSRFLVGVQTSLSPRLKACVGRARQPSRMIEGQQQFQARLAAVVLDAGLDEYFQSAPAPLGRKSLAKPPVDWGPASRHCTPVRYIRTGEVDVASRATLVEVAKQSQQRRRPEQERRGRLCPQYRSDSVLSRAAALPSVAGGVKRLLEAPRSCVLSPFYRVARDGAP